MYASTGDLHFKGYCTRWYVRYRLSYADVMEWFAERGLVVDRSTVYRWVQRFLPLFGEAARAHRTGHLKIPHDIGFHTLSATRKEAWLFQISGILALP